MCVNALICALQGQASEGQSAPVSAIAVDEAARNQATANLEPDFRTMERARAVTGESEAIVLQLQSLPRLIPPESGS
ncbi:MAG: hypothetical protein AAF654_08755 [Myxococcota bacterium]